MREIELWVTDNGTPNYLGYGSFFFFYHKILSRITNCIRIQKLLRGVAFVQESLPSNPQTCRDDWGRLDNKVLMFDKKTPIRGPAIIFLPT